MSDIILFRVNGNEQELVAEVEAAPGVALNRFCPFTDEQRLCGSWCPHFTLYENKEVGITCGGQPTVLQVKQA